MPRRPPAPARLLPSRDCTAPPHPAPSRRSLLRRTLPSPQCHLSSQLPPRASAGVGPQRGRACAVKTELLVVLRSHRFQHLISFEEASPDKDSCLAEGQTG